VLRIDTFAGPSKIHGTGCFTVNPIKIGSVVWESDGENPTHITDWPDNSRYVNHSFSPNTGLATDGITIVALRDMAAGEEITEDYFHTVPHLIEEPLERELKGVYGILPV
jgi:SET domain-containing protein